MLPTKFQFNWVSEEKIKMWKVNGRRMPRWAKKGIINMSYDHLV
jgi:hypothetical protein